MSLTIAAVEDHEGAVFVINTCMIIEVTFVFIILCSDYAWKAQTHSDPAIFANFVDLENGPAGVAT